MMQMHWWWLSLLYLPFVENETWSESGDGCEELPHTCADSAGEPSRERAVLQGETLDKRLNIDGVKSAFTDLLSLVILVFLCSIFSLSHTSMYLHRSDLIYFFENIGTSERVWLSVWASVWLGSGEAAVGVSDPTGPAASSPRSGSG